MKRLKLFPKTFLYTMGIMSMIVLLVHGLMYVMLPSFHLDQKNTEINHKANELSVALMQSNDEEALAVAEGYAIKHNVNITMRVNDEVSRFQGFTPLDIQFDPFVMEEISKQADQQGFQNNDPMDNHQILIENRTLKNIDHTTYDFYLMLSIQPIDETKQVAFKSLPYSIIISFIISLIAAYIYSKVITRPIKNILQVTKDMEALKKDSYCTVDSEDEIGMLAENINALYRTLWHTIHSLEQKVKDIGEVEKEKVEFLRAASHELKTPLTSVHILLENMTGNIGKYKDRDLYLQEASAMVMELTQMLQHILATSKLQTVSREMPTEMIDAGEVLLEVIEDYNILAKAKNIHMSVKLEDTCFYNIHKDALKKVFSNLLANAMNYTEQGKKIDIQIAEGLLTIENECTPLPKEDLEQIFKAFYRPDFSRSKTDGGTGLGLYIVKNILDDANLTYDFQPTVKGMKFTITCGNVAGNDFR